MTPYLIAAREGIICWVTLSLIPVEVVFDWLEDEIERRPLFDASMPCSRLTFWSRAVNTKSATNATTATSFPASIKDSARRGLRSFHSRRSATAALRIDRSNAIRSVDDRRDKSSNSPHQKTSLMLCVPGHSLQRF